MKTIDSLTQGRLKQVLHYDPGTGEFSWLVATSDKIRVGDIAGYVRKDGYSVIKIDGVPYRLHRLAIAYATGAFPQGQVDHIDRNPRNNRLSNLRVVTQKQNNENCGQHSRNTSGIKGVTWNKKDKRWQAQISHNGKARYLGQFIDKDSAAKARMLAQNSLWTHHSHTDQGEMQCA